MPDWPQLLQASHSRHREREEGSTLDSGEPKRMQEGEEPRSQADTKLRRSCRARRGKPSASSCSSRAGQGPGQYERSQALPAVPCLKS